MSLGAASFALTVDQTAFNAGLKSAESAAQSAAGRIGSVLGNIGAGAFTALSAGALTAGAGMAAGLGIGIKAAGDLEQSVANISTIKPTIDTSQVFGALNELSTKVPQSASQLGDSLYNIFSSVDVNQEQALGLLKTFAEGAVGAATDASTFGTSVLGVLNAYGLAAEEAAHVSDIFFNTVNLGVVTGQELASNLGVVTQSAKAAGVSIEELGGLIVGVTKEGGPAAQNINNLSNLLTKITTKDAQKAINDLGISTINLDGSFRKIPDVLSDLKGALADFTESERTAALQKIFPDLQARQGAQTIISQLDTVNSAIEANRIQVGSAAEAYAKMSQTFNSQSKLLQNSLTSVLTTIGAKVLPSITPLVSAFAAQLPAAFDAASAAVGPLLTALGPPLAAALQVIQDSVRTVIQVFQNDWSNGLDEAGNSIQPFTAAVGTVAVFLRDQLIPSVQAFAAAVGPALQSAFGFIVANGDAIKGALLGIGAALAAISAAGGIIAIGSALAALVTPIGLLITGAALLGAAWSTNFLGIQDKTAAAWGVIQPILTGIGDAITTAWTVAQPALAALGDALGQIGASFDAGGINAVLDIISNALTDGLNTLADIAVQALTPVGETISGFFTGIVDTIGVSLAAAGGAFSTGWTAFSSTALSLVEALHQGIASIWNLIPADIQADLVLIGTTLIARFAEFVTQATAWAAQMLAAIQTGWTQIATATSTLWTTITTAIATATAGALQGITTWVDAIDTKVTELGRLVLAGAGIVGKNLLEPITAKLGEVLAAITTWTGDLAARVTAAAATAGAAAAGIGQAIIDGVKNALNAGGAAVGNLLANLARSWITAAKEALGIQSPSTEFYEIGEQSIAGYVKALSDGNSVVADAIRAVVQNALKFGIDPLIALALAKAESSLNPNAIGDNGHSVGLFQLHDQGQGAGQSVAQRQDPQQNAGQFLAAHADLYKQLVAEGLAGDQLAKTFGRLAEVSDPRFADRYAQAYRELFAQFGAGIPAIGQLAASTTKLGTVQQQGQTWAQQMAEEQQALTNTLSQQAPAGRAASDAMAAFGGVLGPIERQVADGAISLNTLEFKLLDVARATGLNSTAFGQLDADGGNIDQVFQELIRSSASLGPQFQAVADYLDSAGSSSREAALRFLQLALNYQQGGDQIQSASEQIAAATQTTTDAAGALAATAPAIGTTETAIAAAGTETAGTAGDVAGMTAKFTALKPAIDAASSSMKNYVKGLGDITVEPLNDQKGAWNDIAQAIDKATSALNDYLDKLASAPDGAAPQGFATGGIVPGTGPRMIIAHGGEMITTRGRTQQLISQPSLLSGYSGGSTAAGAYDPAQTQDWSGADDSRPLVTQVVLNSKVIAEAIDPDLRAIRNKDLTLRRH